MCGYFCIGFIDFMLNDKNLTCFTNLFSRRGFKKKNDNIILNYFKMNVYNSPNIYPNLNGQRFRLNKISEVRDYFIGKVKEWEIYCFFIILISL